MLTGLIVEFLIGKRTIAQKIVYLGEITANSLIFGLVIPPEYNLWGGALIVGPAVIRLAGVKVSAELDKALAGVIGRMYSSGIEEINMSTVIKFMYKGLKKSGNRKRRLGDGEQDD
jgi:hypothetical protein